MKKRVFCFLLATLTSVGVFTACQSTTTTSEVSLPTQEISSVSSGSTGQQTSQSTSLSQISENTSAVVQTADNIVFYPGFLAAEPIALKQGDAFGNFTITSLETEKIEYEIPNTVGDNYNINATFTGDVTLKGKFYIAIEDTMAPSTGEGYIALDLQETEKLPIPVSDKLKNDSMQLSSEADLSSYFLDFSNQAQDIQSITGLTTADGIPCEVVISSFHFLYIYATDARDTAVLKSFTAL